MSYRTHVVIPDLQIRPGVSTKHLPAISRFLETKQPDVVVCIGDGADLPSLSKWNLAGEKEGLRYKKDIESFHDGMSQLTKFRRKMRKRYRMVYTRGNHEERIIRTIFENPNLRGFMSINDLRIRDFGWEEHPFLKVVNIDGIDYSHYFISGSKGQPVTSASALLKARQRSAVMGHVQAFDVAVHPRTQQTAIFAGTCYLQNEKFLGFQGNTCKRQILVLHEVSQGRFDLMAVSLGFLLRKFT